MNDWRDEDPPTQRRLSNSMCPCLDCETDDGAGTTELDPEEFN